MKIIHVNCTMNIGGIESFLMNIYRNINREENEIVFLTYSDEEFDYEKEIISMGGRIIRISNPNSVSIFKHIKQLYEVIKKENPDVVHSHTHFNCAYVMIAAYFSHVRKRICHSHSSYALLEKRILKRIKWFISRTIMKLFSTNLVACSNEAGIALYGKYKFDIIPNGIDISNYKFDMKERKKYRKQYNIKDNEVVIGHIGRIDTPKNHKFLIEVYNEYLKINKNSKLFLIGDGPLYNEINNEIKRKKLDNSIKMLGSRNDVNKILNMFDIVLFPSIYEGFPVSLVEVQANGLQAIISDVITKEIKLTDCIEFYSLKKTSKEWARKIDKDRLIRKNTQKQLKNSIYSIDTTIKKIFDIYN